MFHFLKRKKEPEVQCIGRHFFQKTNAYEIIPYYSDNEICAQELSVCLSIHDWNEFEEQPFYHSLMEYLQQKGIEEITGEL
nr:hypothetical protein [uncultured Anaerotignum sp.]